MTNREYRLKGPYVVLSVLLLLFCVLCGGIVNSVLKSRRSIILAYGYNMELNRKKTKLKPKTGADPGFFLGGCALVSSNKPHSFFVACEQAFGRAGN